MVDSQEASDKQSGECPQIQTPPQRTLLRPVLAHHAEASKACNSARPQENLPPMQDYPRFHLVPARPVFAPSSAEPQNAEQPATEESLSAPQAPLPGLGPETGDESALIAPRRLATQRPIRSGSPSWVFTPSAVTAATAPKASIPLLEAELTPAQTQSMRR